MLRHAAAMMNKGWGFDPSFKSADITLSNGNRTATHVTTSSSYDGALGTAAISGKKVISVTVNSTDGVSGNTGIGVANHSAAITANYLGSNANSGAMYDNGSWWLNAPSTPTATGYSTFQVAADVVDMAVDTPANLLWLRVNNGNWNNNGANNPATGVGGIDISGITGPLYLGVTLAYTAPNAAQVTINAVSPYALPSGFSML